MRLWHGTPLFRGNGSSGREVTRLSSGGFWTLCSVAYASVSWFTDVHPVAVGVVDLDERLPLVGQRVLREDRLDGALRLAGAAVDALLGVDHEHPAGLVDAVHGADVDAGLVFDVDAGLGDDVRHGPTLAKRSVRRRQLGDELGGPLDERRLRDAPGRSRRRGRRAARPCRCGSCSRGSGRPDTCPRPPPRRRARCRRSRGRVDPCGRP